jgi:hypothetical protein
MPARDWTDTLRSGARPCAPLDFGPTDPFGRLDCLLLPLLILSDMSTCDCALSTRTDRRLSDQTDWLTGGDAPTKVWRVSALRLAKVTWMWPHRAVRPWASGRRLTFGTGPLGHSALFPRRAIPWGARLSPWPYPRHTPWQGAARKPHGRTAPFGPNSPLGQTTLPSSCTNNKKS